MIRNNLKVIFLLFFSIIILSTSCTKPHCEEEITRNIFINENSKEFISNYNSSSKVVFLNASGEETSFNIGLKSTIIQSLDNEECEEVPSKRILINKESEHIIVSLVNQSFVDTIYIQLVNFPFSVKEEYSMDNLIIQKGKNAWEIIDSTSTFLLFHPINYENSTGINTKDSLVIFDKVFYNIIEPNYLNSEYDSNYQIKYTKKEGLIYYKDIKNNIELVYDHVE